ncbi:O-antigen flippase Wzx [Bacillus sp. JCM 19046]|nr:O-antigen flippase Wzx [Bacillus sp. JCM 19046]
MIVVDKQINYKEVLKLRSLEVYKNTFRNYKDFPIFRAPQTFINAISQNLPVLMLTAFFGPASAGFYVLSRTVLNMPTQLIGKAVGDVFYPRISEARNNNEDLKSLIKKATYSLAIIGILPFGIIVAFGPQIFSFVFGDEWLIAGEYARWISLWLFFMFINQPGIKAIPVLSLQAFQLRYTIVTLIIRVTAIGIGYYIFSSELIAIALFGVSGAIRTLLLTIIVIRKSGN